MTPLPLLSRRGLIGVAGLTLAGCGAVVRSAERTVTGLRPAGPRELGEARAAWAYFRAAQRRETGLVETVAGGGFTTPSTLGDHLFAAVAARRLGIVEAREFDAAVSGVLQFLGRMELSQGKLPARTYDARTGRWLLFPAQAVDPGWSAVEMGRLLAALRLLHDSQARYRPYIAFAAARWNLCEAKDAQGRLLRATPGAAGFQPQVDAGSGYYDYARQGFRLWGFESAPLSVGAAEASIDIYGRSFDIPADPALVEPRLTAPYALLGLETGFAAPGGALAGERAMAEKIRDVQARRFQETGRPTARTDYRRATAPYDLTDAVAQAGYAWSTADAEGRGHASLALVSTRAAVAMDALWPSPAATAARRAVEALYDGERGWFEGRYELSGGHETTRTAATNAAVLEATLYRNSGPLIDAGRAVAEVPPVKEGAPAACRLPALRG
jgi:hypothetical protein